MSYDLWKFRENPPRFEACKKHGIRHDENDPCRECAERSDKARRIKGWRNERRRSDAIMLAHLWGHE